MKRRFIVAACITIAGAFYVYYNRHLAPHHSAVQAFAAASTKTLESTFYKAPYPGDYKLVTSKSQDGQIEELWTSRGEIGKFGSAITVSSFGTGPKTFNCWAASDAESS